MAEKEKKNDQPGALFIPAGVILGTGVGFLINNIPGGALVGLGLGFVAFAIVANAKK